MTLITDRRSKVLLAWSSGIASVWAVHVLRQQTDIEVVGLLRQFNEVTGRSTFYAERRELVEAQADAAGLPLIPVMLPHQCPNQVFVNRILTCVDPMQLDKRFVGQQYDEKLLTELPPGVDPCGEWGEFHTFCCRCPAFNTEIPVTVGDIVERDGFWFADLRPTNPAPGEHSC